MATIIRKKLIDWDGREFQLDTELDGYGLEAANRSFVIRFNAEMFDPRTSEPQEVSLFLEVRESFDREGISAWINGRHFDPGAEIALSNGLRSDIGDAFIDVRDKPLLDDPAIPEFFPDAIEQAIDAFPAIDPMLGCLIKSGVSATVGQIVRCNNIGAPHRDGINERIHKIFGCLKENIGPVARRAAAKAMWCWLRLGM